MTSPADPTPDIPQYDAFLSHNSREKEAVERIARRLEQEQLKTWLDIWELTPGQSSIKGIEDGLQSSRCCVIFYGPAGVGPWHELERHAALVKSVNSRCEFPVIPVLLPGVTEPPKATLPPLLQDCCRAGIGRVRPGQHAQRSLESRAKPIRQAARPHLSSRWRRCREDRRRDFSWTVNWTNHARMQTTLRSHRRVPGPTTQNAAAMPSWKRDVGRRLDALIVRTVPGVSKAVRWNSPFYGLAGQGWFLGFHTFTNFVKVSFFRGTSLRPVPPGGTGQDARWIDIHEDDLDEAQMATWIRQAAALPGWGKS